MLVNKLAGLRSATAIAMVMFFAGQAQAQTTNGSVYKVGNGVSAPKVVSSPDPPYPNAARDAKYECTVVLWTVVGTDGHTHDTKVARPCGMGLDEAAVETVRNWKFEPAKKNDASVAVQINIQVNFRLTGGAEPGVEQLQSADAALKAGDYGRALPVFQSFVDRHPENAAAWNFLGQAQVGTGRLTDALASFRRGAELHDIGAQNNLARVLVLLHRTDEAIAAGRKAVEVAPATPTPHYNLAMALMQAKQYAEATKELETIAGGDYPGKSQALYLLGECYLAQHQEEKAVSSFTNALAAGRTPVMLNNVAYQYAQAGVELQRARQLAQTALAIDTAELRTVELDHISAADLSHVSNIARTWDTLGWIEFQDGNIAKAVELLNAAWAVEHSPVVAEHLGKVSDRQGRPQDAIRWYALADVMHGSPEVRSRLLALAGSESKVRTAEDGAEAAKATLEQFTIPNTAKKDGKAEFLVSVASGAKVSGVKIVSGDAWADAVVRSLSEAVSFPAPDAILIRRGTVGCSAQLGKCEVTLLNATEAESFTRRESYHAVAILPADSSRPVPYTSTGTAVRLTMPPMWHVAVDRTGSFSQPGFVSINKAGTLATVSVTRDHLETSADAYQKLIDEKMPALFPNYKLLSETPVVRSGSISKRVAFSASKDGADWRGWMEVVSIGDEHYRVMALAPAERFSSYAAEFEKIATSVELPGAGAAVVSSASGQN